MNKCDINFEQTILAAAKEIALQQGINKITIRLVAKKSGVSIGTVYNYYSTKADLLVAVIEDFWKEALRKSDFKTLGDKDFYEKIQEIYNGLYEHLRNFKTNWLKQISLLNIEEKKLGRKKEKEFFSKIHIMIISLMDSDESLRDKTWRHDLSKGKLAEFIFDNMLLMLKKNEDDIEYFIIILKKIMSN